MMLSDIPRAEPRDAARHFWTLTGLSAALLAIYAIGLAADPRLLDGVPVWLKPAKFALSFVALFATMALVAERLSPAVRTGWGVAFLAGFMAVNYLAEMAYMTFRAGRVEHSHFNLSTPFAEAAYTVMGVSALCLIAGVAWLGVAAWRDRGAALGPQLRLGILLGFALTFALTFVVAGYLGANGGHHVGTPATGAAIPLLGWSREVGDLRPAHFLSIHAMQALPLAGLALDRIGVRGALPMIVLAATYSVLTIAVFGQALLGWPLV